MKNLLFLFLLFFLIAHSHAQSAVETGKITAPKESNPVHVHQVSGDSLVSTFIIFIAEQVPMHKHEFHSENVYVLEGTATMTLGSDRLEIKPGDLIFIPANTWHDVKVSSDIPLKVISIQAPEFDGKDRVIYKNQ